MCRTGSRDRVRRWWEVRDKERRSGMEREARTWRRISGGSESNCIMAVDSEGGSRLVHQEARERKIDSLHCRIVAG